jgi:hypothetical protein
MRDLAIREPYMAESADRFGYTLHVLLYPSPVKKSYRAVMRELAFREPCMAQSAGRLGYPVHVLPYPTPGKQPFRARYE